MPNVTITQLPLAGPITGSEAVAIVQNGQTLRTTTGAISASPAQQQTFLTLNQEMTLPNSRALSSGTGIGLIDGGALSTLQITLNGASGSLESAANGIMAKTGSNTLAARQIAATGAGVGVTNGNAVSGNPTIALTGLAAAIANVGGTGMLSVVGGATIGGVQIVGTSNQVAVANGNGVGNPTISLVANPVIPGTAGMVIPHGTTAQQPVGTTGQVRFNTDTQTLDVYSSGSWLPLLFGSSTVTSFSAGSTGLLPASPALGAVTLSGILNPGSGGTGVNNGARTITLGGNFTTAGAAITLTATGPTNITLPTSGTLVTLTGAQALTNKTVNGLTITPTTGTLELANGSKLATSGANPITFTSVGTTNLTLPQTGTLVTLNGIETLGNKTLISPIISNGTGSFSGTVTCSPGSVSAPSLTFGDATTGLYRSAPDEVAITQGGQQRIRFDANGQITYTFETQALYISPASMYVTQNFDHNIPVIGAPGSGINWRGPIVDGDPFRNFGGITVFKETLTSGEYKTRAMLCSASGAYPDPDNILLFTSAAQLCVKAPAWDSVVQATLEVRGDGYFQDNVGLGVYNPKNKLDINGSLGRNAPVAKDNNFTLADTENWIICNGSTTLTIAFPPPADWTGREVMIKNIGSFPVESATSDISPLDGGAFTTAILAGTPGQWATLVSNGNHWVIMQSN